MTDPRKVYEFTHREYDDLEYTTIILAEDVFTALAKWRTYVNQEKLTGWIIGGGDEPDSIVRLDDARVLA